MFGKVSQKNHKKIFFSTLGSKKIQAIKMFLTYVSTTTKTLGICLG